ncbi:MAG: zinc-binding alcohol dehydrogenase family protein [Solirubrobacterales bacterium]
MRAVVYERFGGPDVLELRDWPEPEVGDGQLLVAVRAAGVNPVDAQNRASGDWARLEPPVIPGYDFSGVVESVGPGADGFAVGDEVFGGLPVRVTRSGSYAEYVAVDAGIVAAKPDCVSYHEAAAMTVAGCTSHESLRRLRLEPGEWLLICGAGGGVGSFAVQIGAAAGARVIAVASARHHELLAELGAEACVDYTAEDVGEAVERIAGEVDALADYVGGRTLERMLPLVREGGRAVEIAGIEGNVEEVIDRNLELHGVLFNPADPEPLRAVAAEFASGRLRPIVSDVLALADAAEAHRRIEAGHQQGKLVLEVAS